jgi:D-alanine transaminase
LPASDVRQTVVVVARSQPRAAIAAQAEKGIAVVTRRDPRWARCDIKTVMLLPAVLAKHDAKAEGAKEVWFLDASGNVTEGASSNAWIVTANGTLVTRFLDARILPGITRATALDAARALQLPVEERSFTLQEARAAREAFITSATNTVMPVVTIDGQSVGDGKPGSLTVRLRQAFHHAAEITDS